MQSKCNQNQSKCNQNSVKKQPKCSQKAVKKQPKCSQNAVLRAYTRLKSFQSCLETIHFLFTTLRNQSLYLFTARSQEQQSINNRIGEILSSAEPNRSPSSSVVANELPNIVDSSETFESVVPQISEAEQVQQQIINATNSENGEEVRVYVRCNYCDTFR